MALPKPYLQPITWLKPKTKPDPYNPESQIADWNQTPTETPLSVSWWNQAARLTDDEKRTFVAWTAQVGIPTPEDPELAIQLRTLKPGDRIRHEASETVWNVISVIPPSTSPYTGWIPGIVAELELPVG